ncbi:MAG: hypothetical protein FWG94_13180 [Oscillospiraceae bacterium]|nr:hypothetical protein [Oscillospiraceae bacterium]
MSEQKNGERLFKDFSTCDYQELEELASRANDKTEREFYVQLCNFFLAKNQPRIMEEKPF